MNRQFAKKRLVKRSPGPRLVIFSFKGFFFLFLCYSTCTLFGQPGSLDMTFGNNGIVTTSIDPVLNVGTGMVFTSSNKIILEGYSGYTDAIRYKNNGTVDSTFAVNGIATNTSSNFGADIIQQSDGKLVITGGVSGFGKINFFTYRYLPDGSIDPSFAQNGVSTFSITDGSDNARKLALQSDGKIVVAGEASGGTSNGLILVRYLPNGTLDNTFGNNGIVILAIGNPTSLTCEALAIQQDGKILVGGRDNNFLLIRYNSDGTLDMPFGVNGVVTNTAGSGKSIAVLSDGKILMAGGPNSTLLRFNSNGSIDNTFGNNGIAINTPSLRTEVMTIQPDNKIVIAGWIGGPGVGTVAVTRYNTDGSIDNSFGNNGLVMTDINPGLDIPHTILLQPDGKILVGGESNDPNSGHGYFFLARYKSGLQIGIKENSKNMSEISVYPNPFTDKLKLIYSDTVNPLGSEILIYSVIGSLVHKQKVNKSGDEIGLAFLPKGIYYLRIVQQDQIKSIKISKE
jgi:uncharacterized delta-60 repeat protein